MAKFISLKKNHEILSVVRKQNKMFGSKITIYFQPNNLNCLRLAISISKKHFKLATTRNKIKRQIKAWFLAVDTNLLNYDIVTIVKPSYQDGSFILDCNNLQKQLNKIKNFKKGGLNGDGK